MNHLESEGFQKVSTVDESLRVFLNAVGRPRIRLESIAANRALGRVLGEDVLADRFLPAVDRSVVDGFAVRSEDLKTATKAKPAKLNIVGESRLGKPCRVTVSAGKAVVMATGSMMPSGADAVVMVEETFALPGGLVEVYSQAVPGQHISRKGEDATPGKQILRKGRRLRPEDIGIMKALGRTKIRVARKPKVGVISTGDELVESAAKMKLGKIVDLNRPILSGLLEQLGAVPVDMGIARDREREVTIALRRALKVSDAVLISAGSSVGKRDFIPKCINSLGKPGMLVHGVAMRPALPTGLAMARGKPIVSLPGFPVSAMIAFRAFCRPLIATLSGTRAENELTVRAVLKDRINGLHGHRTYVRVTLTHSAEGLAAEPVKTQRSSALMSMVDANGIVTIPEGVATVEAGQVVEVAVNGEIES